MELIIVGLDGLEPTLVEEWKDDLPTLRRFMEKGAFGRIRSSDPPLSAPAWPWMYTGKQGGKHGCFGFTKRDTDSYDRNPVNYSDIGAESIWEALDFEGISCGVMNVPLTYPPSDLEHGFVVAGWPVPNRVDVGSPTSVVDEIEEVTGERYKVNPFPMGPELRDASPERVLEHVTEAMWHHERAFDAALSINEVEVFFCVFMATDVAGHYLCWDRDLLKSAYVEQDRALGELIAEYVPGTDVIVLGDHGHAAQSEWNFFINEWLKREGYLAVREDVPVLRRKAVLRRAGITRENLFKLKQVVGIDDVRDVLPQWAFDALKANVPGSAVEGGNGFDPRLIDWTRTVAYSGDQNVIYLNTVEAHPNGIVESGEESQITEEIVTGLGEIDHPDPEREEPLVSEVKRGEDIFSGPYVADAPALVFLADDMYCPALMGFNGEGVFSRSGSGEHRPYGALITAGPSFASTDGVSDCDIVDLFPLILSLLDAPVPGDADGAIPDDRLRAHREPRYRESRDTPARRREYSDEESRDVREQLEGLGYLE